MKPIEHLSLPLSPLTAGTGPRHLRSHLHGRIQKGDRLRNQGKFLSPEPFHVLLLQELSSIGNLPFHRGVFRQKAHNGMGQQAFSRTAGTGYRHNFTRPHIQVQVRNHLQVVLLQAPVVHPEGHGEVFHLQNRPGDSGALSLHFCPAIHARCMDQ